MPTEFAHSWLDVVSVLGTLGAFIVGVLIKNAFGMLKLELEKRAGEIKGSIDVHVARDDEKHSNFDRRLTNLEERVDNI